VIANCWFVLGVTLALVSKSVPGKNHGLLATYQTAFQALGMEHIVVIMFLQPPALCWFWRGLRPEFRLLELSSRQLWQTLWGGMVFIAMLFYSTSPLHHQQCVAAEA